MFLVEVEQACALLLVPAQTVNKCPFHGLFCAMFFTFFYFSLLKMAPVCSAEVLSSVPERKKAVMRLTEKTCVRHALIRHES